MTMQWLRASVAGLIVLSVHAPHPLLARNASVLEHPPQPVVVVDGSNVHNAGKVELHVTNWGEFGSEPGSANTFEFAPSFRWPNSSGAEYLYAAGLWVGALKAGVPAVSTAVFEHEFRPTADPVDIIYQSSEGAPGGNRLPNLNRDDDHDGRIDEETLNGRDDDGDGMIDEDYAAASNQMFSCEYFDNDPVASVIYPQHNPLGLRVRQESYVWSEARFDDIVGIKFTIKNVGTYVLQDVYVGMFVDGDIGHRETPDYWQDDAAASTDFGIRCTDLGPVNPRVAYVFDADGDAGGSPGYISVQFVGHPIDPSGQTAPTDIGFTSFRIFSGNQAFEDGGDPTNDFERYEVMSDGLIARDRPIPNDYRMLISVGPFVQFAPDQEMVVHVALAIGNSFNNMRFNSFNAVHAFRGEWFDADLDAHTGVSGRETRVDGPTGQVVIDACANPPVVVPSVPAGSSVYVNADCTLEALYAAGCPALDSTLTMTGIGGKETQQQWYIPIDVTLPVLIQQFVARAEGTQVRLSWDVFADEPVLGYRVYRGDGGSPMREITDRMLSLDATNYVDADVRSGVPYVYKLAVALPDGREIGSSLERVQLGALKLDLAQNSPNPFNPTTTISFTVPARGPVTLSIYDVEGKRIRTLVDGVMPVGANHVEWDGKDASGAAVSSGLYFYRLETARNAISRKMVFLK
jgi:FlgD Ig-like domain